MKPLTLIVLICTLLLHAPAILLADPGTGSGTVAEAIDAGSYTYLRLEDPDMWIATTLLRYPKVTTSGSAMEWK